MASYSGELNPGTQVGPYTVENLLGSGATGEVYSAHSAAGDIVALKVLRDNAAQRLSIVARFQREAKILASIQSPFVAKFIADGVSKDGRLWIASERLCGEGLDARLKREYYLPFSDLAWIIRDILEGLLAAHRVGVIHRDIKPANLFIEKLSSGGERAKILDFGISKIRRDTEGEASLTAADSTLGSIPYMSPEQVKSAAKVDSRADLYGVGIVLYRALAGRFPFEAKAPYALIALKLERDAPSLSIITGETWPQPIERFVVRMLARSPDDRYESIEAAQNAWVEVCQKMGALSSSALPSAAISPIELPEQTDVGSPTITRTEVEPPDSAQ